MRTMQDTTDKRKICDMMWKLQIASALSRPEAFAARTTDIEAVDPTPEAESILSPDEALHSIHEEPEETVSGHRDDHPSFEQGPSPIPEQSKQGHSREPTGSFAQAESEIDRQSTQPLTPQGQHPTWRSGHSRHKGKEFLRLLSQEVSCTRFNQPVQSICSRTCDRYPSW